MTIISRRGAINVNFAWALIPYTVAALALAAAGIAAPDAPAADPPFTPLNITVTEEDYFEHFIFQSTFSLRSLNDQWAGGWSDPPQGRNTYQFTPDGLLELFDGDGILENDDFTRDDLQGSAPPFPLDELIRDMGRTPVNADRDRISPPSTQGLLFALLPLLFILPCLIIKLFSGTLIDDSHESVFISSRRTFFRRSHRPS